MLQNVFCTIKKNMMFVSTWLENGSEVALFFLSKIYDCLNHIFFHKQNRKSCLENSDKTESIFSKKNQRNQITSTVLLFLNSCKIELWAI